MSTPTLSLDQLLHHITSPNILPNVKCLPGAFFVPHSSSTQASASPSTTTAAAAAGATKGTVVAALSPVRNKKAKRLSFWELYLQLRTLSGTLDNGFLYVDVSKSHATPILGLFANRDFPKDSIVTEYGGLETHVKDIAENKKTHAYKIPRSDYVYDGWADAQCFKVEGKTVALVGSDEQTDRIRANGLGYMMNEPSQDQKVNVKVHCCRKDVNAQALQPEAIFFRASKDIAKGEEILCHYNWASVQLLQTLAR